MTIWNNFLTQGFVVALTSLSLTTSAQGLVGAGGGGPVGGASVNIGTGGVSGAQGFALQVVCVDCTLEEVKQAYPDQLHFYTLKHRLGEAVVKVTWGDDSADSSVDRQVWQNRVALGDYLWVRAEDDILRALMAEENRFKPFALNAILRKDRTLDISAMSFIG